MPEIAGIAHIVINVSDPERSADFYRDVFGFRVVQPLTEQGIIGLFHPSAKVGLGLQRRRTSDAVERDGQVLDHVAFRVRDRQVLDDCGRHLTSLGIAVEVETNAGGSSISVFDPDGNEVEFFAPAPRAASD